MRSKALDEYESNGERAGGELLYGARISGIKPRLKSVPPDPNEKEALVDNMRRTGPANSV